MSAEDGSILSRVPSSSLLRSAAIFQSKGPMPRGWAIRRLTMHSKFVWVKEKKTCFFPPILLLAPNLFFPFPRLKWVFFRHFPELLSETRCGSFQVRGWEAAWHPWKAFKIAFEKPNPNLSCVIQEDCAQISCSLRKQSYKKKNKFQSLLLRASHWIWRENHKAGHQEKFSVGLRRAFRKVA